jgi:hypothetical protein
VTPGMRPRPLGSSATIPPPTTDGSFRKGGAPPLHEYPRGNDAHRETRLATAGPAHHQRCTLSSRAGRGRRASVERCCCAVFHPGTCLSCWTRMGRMFFGNGGVTMIWSGTDAFEAGWWTSPAQDLVLVGTSRRDVGGWTRARLSGDDGARDRSLAVG